MLHVIALVPGCVSCETLDAIQLLFRWLDCHGSFKWVCTILYPLFVQYRSVWVLVVFLSLNKFGQRNFKLRQILEHHLLEAEMTPVEKNGNQAGVKFYCCLIVNAYLELGQVYQNFFNCFVKQFVELVNLYLTVRVLHGCLLCLPSTHRKAFRGNELLCARPK